jgi:NAD(P)-dependent dehydrogenase (short-subunit alcohol dehydrogenase family)
VTALTVVVVAEEAMAGQRYVRTPWAAAVPPRPWYAAGMSERPGPVLVTGANSGIGLAAAVRLAGRGWRVWGTVRSGEKAERLCAAAEAVDVDDRVRPLLLDVSDHQAVVAAFADLPDFYAVVNNAGMTLTGAVEEVPAQEARALLDVNLVAPAVVSACALPGMRRLGGGRIVMVSSLAGRAAVLPFQGWYHASKFGLEALSDVLRVEVAGFGVRVVVVQPGFVSTGLLGKSEQQADTRDPASSRYAPGYARVARLTGLVESLAPSVGVVAGTVVTAVESRRPRRRYVVGVESLPVRGVASLPDEITDRLVRLVADLRPAPPSDPRPGPTSPA